MSESIILASTSPRRKELLGKICDKFEVMAPQIEEEHMDRTLPLGVALEKLAREKATSIAVREKMATVIGADTIVVLDDVVLGKPTNSDDAVAMLKRLSGRTHEVMTAVAVCKDGGKICETFHVVSYVTFRTLSDEEIKTYVAGGEPLDKAGSYGIQGEGGALVDHYTGSYDNIVGLPVEELAEHLS